MILTAMYSESTPSPCFQPGMCRKAYIRCLRFFTNFNINNTWMTCSSPIGKDGDLLEACSALESYLSSVTEEVRK